MKCRRRKEKLYPTPSAYILLSVIPEVVCEGEDSI